MCVANRQGFRPAQAQLCCNHGRAPGGTEAEPRFSWPVPAFGRQHWRAPRHLAHRGHTGPLQPPSLGQTPRQRLGAATLQGTRHGSHGLLRHASQRQHRHHHHAEGGSDWLCTASLCARTTTKRKGFQMKRNDAKSRVWNGTAMAHGTSRGLHSTRRLGVSISSFSVHRSCPMVGEPWQFIWSLVC